MVEGEEQQWSWWKKEDIREAVKAVKERTILGQYQVFLSNLTHLHLLSSQAIPDAQLRRADRRQRRCIIHDHVIGPDILVILDINAAGITKYIQVRLL